MEVFAGLISRQNHRRMVIIKAQTDDLTLTMMPPKSIHDDDVTSRRVERVQSLLILLFCIASSDEYIRTINKGWCDDDEMVSPIDPYNVFTTYVDKTSRWLISIMLWSSIRPRYILSYLCHCNCFKINRKITSFKIYKVLIRERQF